MSKQICNAAGGDLKLCSQLMIGSEFSFTMAVKKVPQASDMNEPPAMIGPSTRFLPPIPTPQATSNSQLLKNLDEKPLNYNNFVTGPPPRHVL